MMDVLTAEAEGERSEKQRKMAKPDKICLAAPIFIID